VPAKPFELQTKNRYCTDLLLKFRAQASRTQILATKLPLPGHLTKYSGLADETQKELGNFSRRPAMTKIQSCLQIDSNDIKHSVGIWKS